MADEKAKEKKNNGMRVSGTREQAIIVVRIQKAKEKKKEQG